MRALANKLKTLVGNMKGHFAGELGKLAQMGNITNKSPLEVPDTGPLAHMKEDPFQYGFVHYPGHIGQIDEGHYMIFLVVENNKTKITPGGRNNNKNFSTEVMANSSAAGQSEIKGSLASKRQSDKYQSRMQAIKSGKMRDIMNIRGQNSGIEKSSSKTNYTVSKGIFLYTPPAISSGLEVEYANVEGGLLGGFLKVLAEQFKGEGSMIDKLRKMELGDFKGVPEGILRGALEAMGAQGTRAKLQKSSGRARNPALEVIFESVPFRTFDYEYTFAPRNSKELKNVHQIIQLFRFHMLPELATGNDMSETMYNLPSQFEIRYMYKEKENIYIPRVSRCVLNSCNINYTPHEAFTTFKGDGKGASPNIMTMSLSFTEMEVMTKNTVAMGY